MKVSIITITFNSAATIRDTLESVANQRYNNIEHIIIDGNSTDDTLSIVATFPHISKVISEPDKGVYDAMNKGIAIATGDIIGMLHSDDIYATEDIIQEIVSPFQKHSTISSIYGNLEYFKENQKDKIIRYWKAKPYHSSFFEDGEAPPHPTLFVRKKVYEKIGGYWADFKISGDNEFMFRMLKIYQFKSFYLDKTIVKMRLGGISTRGFKSYLISTIELTRVWTMNGYQYPKHLLYKRPLKKLPQLFKNK
ncbi:MAG: glycosyltransferase family 2 protein [Saprospiraceae bacterium]